MLPEAALAPTVTPLKPKEVLYMVMGSARRRARSSLVQSTWCQWPRGQRCLFFSDGEDAAGETQTNSSLPLVTLVTDPPPQGCCDESAGRRLADASAGASGAASKKGAKGSSPSKGRRRRVVVRRVKRRTSGKPAPAFFCREHRMATLHAQYRFLPALSYAKRSAAFKSGEFRWVLLVDDDSFVFTRRLGWLLARLDHSYPLYAGDFSHSGEAGKFGVPYFACGGGGSLLSAAALRAMDVDTCIATYRSSCMQSDWMVGGCALWSNVSALRQLGCGTCEDPRKRRVSSVRSKLTSDKCFFMQNATPVAPLLPLGRRSAAVVHGIGGDGDGAAARLESFFGKMTQLARGKGAGGGKSGGGGGAAAAAAKPTPRPQQRLQKAKAKAKKAKANLAKAKAKVRAKAGDGDDDDDDDDTYDHSSPDDVEFQDFPEDDDIAADEDLETQKKRKEVNDPDRIPAGVDENGFYIMG